MKIWLPGLLYHVFPLLSVILGFLIVMLIHTPAAIILAAIMYAYSFTILWFRDSDETEDRA